MPALTGMLTARRVLVLAPFLLLGCEPAPPSVDASAALDAGTLAADAARDEGDGGHDPDAHVEADASIALDAPPTSDAAPVVCASDAGVSAPTFRELYVEVLTPHGCGTCHDGLSTAWGSSLDLSSTERAYAGLLGPIGCNDVTPRVTPCDPSSSTLAMVPTGRSEPCGGRHTFWSETATGIVTPEEAARIDAWILAGAPY